MEHQRKEKESKLLIQLGKMEKDEKNGNRSYHYRKLDKLYQAHKSFFLCGPSHPFIFISIQVLVKNQVERHHSYKNNTPDTMEVLNCMHHAGEPISDTTWLQTRFSFMEKQSDRSLNGATSLPARDL